MIWVLLPVVFLVGLAAGFVGASLMSGDIAARTIHQIMDESGYEIRDGKIAPKGTA